MNRNEAFDALNAAIPQDVRHAILHQVILTLENDAKHDADIKRYVANMLDAPTPIEHSRHRSLLRGLINAVAVANMSRTLNLQECGFVIAHLLYDANEEDHNLTRAVHNMYRNNSGRTIADTLRVTVMVIHDQDVSLPWGAKTNNEKPAASNPKQLTAQDFETRLQPHHKLVLDMLYTLGGEVTENKRRLYQRLASIAQAAASNEVNSLLSVSTDNGITKPELIRSSIISNSNAPTAVLLISYLLADGQEPHEAYEKALDGAKKRGFSNTTEWLEKKIKPLIFNPQPEANEQPEAEQALQRRWEACNQKGQWNLASAQMARIVSILKNHAPIVDITSHIRKSSNGASASYLGNTTACIALRLQARKQLLLTQVVVEVMAHELLNNVGDAAHDTFLQVLMANGNKEAKALWKRAKHGKSITNYRSMQLEQPGPGESELHKEIYEAVLKYSLNDHAADALSYAAAATNSMQSIIHQQEITMSKANTAFTTIHYVYGVPVEQLNDAQLIDAIQRVEKEIADLKKVESKSTFIDNRIAELDAARLKIVESLDARAPAKTDKSAKAK